MSIVSTPSVCPHFEPIFFQTRPLTVDQCTELFKKTLEGKSADKVTVLFTSSCEKPETELVTALLIRSGVSPNTPIPHFTSKLSMPPLFTLMQTQSSRMCHEVIMHPDTTIFCEVIFNNKTYTISVLHSAILQGKHEVVKSIFESKKYPADSINKPANVIGSSGQIGKAETPLSLATRKFQPELMQYLIQARARIYQESPDQEDCLIKATKLGSDSKTLAFLLDQEEVLANKKHTSLLHTLAKNSVMPAKECLASATILIAQGYLIDALDRENHTPLYISAQNPKRNDLSAFLLGSGADLLELYKPCDKERSHLAPVLDDYRAKIHRLCETTALLKPILQIVENYLFDNDAYSAFISNVSIHYMQE